MIYFMLAWNEWKWCDAKIAALIERLFSILFSLHDLYCIKKKIERGGNVREEKTSTMPFNVMICIIWIDIWCSIIKVKTIFNLCTLRILISYSYVIKEMFDEQ